MTSPFLPGNGGISGIHYNIKTKLIVFLLSKPCGNSHSHFGQLLKHCISSNLPVVFRALDKIQQSNSTSHMHDQAETTLDIRLKHDRLFETNVRLMMSKLLYQPLITYEMHQ